MIVALSNAWMKGQPNAPLCGRKVKATNKKNGKTVVVTVADTCAGCGANDLDFSVGAWNALTDNAPWGTFPAAWCVVTKGEKKIVLRSRMLILKSLQGFCINARPSPLTSWPALHAYRLGGCSHQAGRNCAHIPQRRNICQPAKRPLLSSIP
ncbi:uncharacterized protein CIMG_03006 [Coccidioides immitis RS]|uniref:RlpA-like protein double-psi beta-barrel domain-containing protein n=1 Tax=Coccidioides immitis (strain RS) TaxID=246410 RepID=J3KAE4_COCIM|nr:uncharacterized protein CIMG_03006 [Coccidioides immitis RS]EAS31982.3 hypothetical protein CIMG_03006 [Coccidioides immitis RS]